MGANDNLSGLATCYELAKYFSDPIHQPQSCEIWIAGYGCEEIGTRGSKAFVKLHSAELHNASVVTLDMIGVKNGILLVEKGEIYGMVHLSKKLANNLLEIARKNQLPLEIDSEMAFTDSLSFSRGHIQDYDNRI